MRPLSLVVLALALTGCKSANKFVLTPEENYTFSSSIAADSLPVQEKTDLEINWCSLSVDLLGNDLTPGIDVQEVDIVHFDASLSHDDVLTGINDGTLLTSDTVGFAQYTPSHSECHAMATEFSLYGTAVNPETDLTANSGVYMATVASIDANQKKTYRMFQFFVPDTTSDNTRVLITNDSATLSYTADLQASTPIVVPADEPKLNFDWNDLAVADPESYQNVDTILIGQYSKSLSDLEGDFLHLQGLADHTWTGDVDQFTDAWTDLVVTDSDGAAFPGFTAGSDTWILALECSSCLNPAPPFLAVVTPE